MSPSATPPPIPWSIRHRWLRRLLFCFSGLVVLVVLFYAEENWRGKRAWEKCKRELEAKGEVLDWSAYIPPPVPDDQNIFKAPRMTEWFVRANTGGFSNDLNSRLSQRRLSDFVTQHTASNVAEVTFVSLETIPPPKDADIVLRYEEPLLTIAPAEKSPSDPDILIPLIVIRDVDLLDVITNLARQAQLKYVLDPTVRWGAGVDDKPASQPTVSIRWENVTARQALMALLNNYDLVWIDDPKTAIARITAKKPGGPQVYADPDVRERLSELISRAFGLDTNAPAVNGPQGILLVAQPLYPGKPARVFVQAGKIPPAKEIAEFFPTNALGADRSPTSHFQVEAAGSNSFRVFFSPEIYSARDYLSWSDQFESDFNLIREALKRPHARMDDDYQKPFEIPTLNFLCSRVVAQTLAQRAQCYLLLGEPDKALQELTLIYDLNRLLEIEPQTLVSAMINVAVAGLYAEVIKDGMRLRAWREPELTALQEQLKRINLLLTTATAFRRERAATCRTLQTISAERLVDKNSDASKGMKLLKFNFMLRGWIYQNMAIIARLEQKPIELFNLVQGTIKPPQEDYDLANVVTHPRPWNWLAAIAVPNYRRSTQALASNQTKANEAQIACALERYRLAKGKYPETLAALSPQFIGKIPHDIIGGQPLKYRPADDSFVLYSVGWNETDDGGLVGQDKETGDWVWQYPQN